MRPADTKLVEDFTPAQRPRLTAPTACVRADRPPLPAARPAQSIPYSCPENSQVPQATNRFLWDDKVLLTLVFGNDQLEQSYLRGLGLGLGGSMQGVGGVGGLLAIGDLTIGNLQSQTHLDAFDGNGNGNVSAHMNADTGTESARYEYDPFGNTLRATGPAARANSLRFSTQFADDVTGHVKYLYRDYDAGMGRWMSRDPKGELGDISAYCFIRNNSYNSIDLFGNATVQVWIQTLIRPPHSENGTKTIHAVSINQFGLVTSQIKFVGITPTPPVLGVVFLNVTVSGTHPKFTIALRGTAFSVFPLGIGIATSPAVPTVGVGLAALIIDYAIDVELGFCAREGRVSGAHDSFPSYVVSVKGNKVYDFQQTTILGLLPPMDVNPDVRFRW